MLDKISKFICEGLKYSSEQGSHRLCVSLIRVKSQDCELMIILFSIILNRIIFHNPFAAKFMPTMFILIAPPAIGFISYIKLIKKHVRLLIYICQRIFIRSYLCTTKNY